MISEGERHAEPHASGPATSRKAVLGRRLVSGLLREVQDRRESDAQFDETLILPAPELTGLFEVQAKRTPGQPAYRVLGPLEVCAVTGERISIARPKHRQLLATLLLSHNAVVTTDHLLGNLWEDGQPSTAR